MSKILICVLMLLVLVSTSYGQKDKSLIIYFPFDEGSGEVAKDFGPFKLEGDLIKKPAGINVSRDRAEYWDGKNESGEPVASGIYFYTIQAGNFTATKKMVILR